MIDHSTQCPACFESIVEPGTLCSHCLVKLPGALVKALSETSDYGCGLRDGSVIRFASATVHGPWVHLHGAGGPVSGLEFPCPRGVDVRLDHITWIADATEGT